MQRSAREQSGRNLPVRAILLFSLAAAIGLGLAGDASAIDPLDQPRKAAKHAPPGKGKALGKGTAVRAGTALPTTALPTTALPKTVLPKTVLPKTVLPKTVLPKTDLPKSAVVRDGAALRDGATPRGGAAAGKGTPASTSNPVRGHHYQPAAVASRPGALANRPAAVPNAGQRRELSKSIAHDHHRLRVEHRRSILIARSRLPHRPLPGERGFTGVPPVGETRFISNEMVFQVGSNISQQTVDTVARRLGLSAVASHTSSLTGGTFIHFRVAQGRPIADVVRALEAEKIGIASPNYVFRLAQDTDLAARTEVGDPSQYVVNKLRLGEVHRLTTGSNVLVAVIDSEIDLKHPDLEGAIVERFDAVGRRSEPHAHGTGMAGAIAARRKLMGVAPGARILAVHAFSPEAKEAPQATTRHILAGLEWAIQKGARVINMSFAGPHDPMLQLALKKAHEKGVVLVAAAGNMGPKSPPLYPAADPHVIAVTATDESDKLFAQANQGPHVAVAAPGVNILEPAPNGGYQLTTGTSVAAAHVSGVAALLIERNPSLDPAAVHEILTASAKNAGSKGRDDKFGWGLVDPSRALVDLDAKLAQDQAGTPGKAATSKPGPLSAR